MGDDDKKATRTSAKANKGFSAEEKAAMRERAREMKAEATRADGERDLLEKIAAMSGPDRVMAERLHTIITANAPALAPKTWYGMPAYADADGKIVIYFRDAGKFKERYSNLGFQDTANLDDGDMWPICSRSRTGRRPWRRRLPSS